MIESTAKLYATGTGETWACGTESCSQVLLLGSSPIMFVLSLSFKTCVLYRSSKGHWSIPNLTYILLFKKWFITSNCTAIFVDVVCLFVLVAVLVAVVVVVVVVVLQCHHLIGAQVALELMSLKGWEPQKPFPRWNPLHGKRRRDRSVSNVAPSCRVS